MNASSNKSNVNNPSENAGWISEIGFVYFQTIICFIGTFLNLINVIVFTRKKFNTSTYILMVALSVADGLTLAIRIPQGLVWCRKAKWCRKIHGMTKLYRYSLYVDVPLTNMTETISGWITVALALDRYIAMRHYNISKTKCTVTNARILSMIISGIAIVFNMPFFFLYNTRYSVTSRMANLTRSNSTGAQLGNLITESTKFGGSVHFSIYSWVRLFIVQFLPLLFLCVFNCLLLILVSSHNRRFYEKNTARQAAVPLTASTEADLNDKSGALRGRSASNVAPHRRMHRAQTKLTILLIAIIALFLGGQIPQAFAYHSIFPHLGTCNGIHLSKCNSYIIFRTVSQNLALIAYSATFFVYLLLNRHFQESLREIFCPGSNLFREKDVNNYVAEQNSKVPNKKDQLGVPGLTQIENCRINTSHAF